MSLFSVGLNKPSLENDMYLEAPTCALSRLEVTIFGTDEEEFK